MKKEVIELKLLIDKQASLELFEKNKGIVEQKYCYNNTFNLLSQDDDVLMKVARNEWKIAYCFFRVFDNQDVYVRHACFCDVKRHVIIDATATLLNSFNERKNIEYKIIKLMDYHEYIDALKKYHLEPALTKYLDTETESMRAELISNGCMALD